MKILLRQDEINLSDFSIIAKHSSLNPFSMGIVFLLPFLVLISLRPDNLPNIIYVSALLLFISSYFPLKMFFLTLNTKTNWLLAINGEHLLCKYRSPLNKHFSSSDVQIIALPFSIISSYQKVSVRRDIATQTGRSERHFLTFLDIHINAN